MENIRVDEMLPPKQSKNGWYWPVKSGGKTYNLDKEAKLGDEITGEVNVSSFTRNGQQMSSRWMKVQSVKQAPAPGTAGIGLYDLLDAVQIILDRLPPAWINATEGIGPRAAATIVNQIIQEIGRGN